MNAPVNVKPARGGKARSNFLETSPWACGNTSGLNLNIN